MPGDGGIASQWVLADQMDGTLAFFLQQRSEGGTTVDGEQ
jgi:hypothetical protein